MKTGIELIAEERKRQIEVEQFDSTHDKGNAVGEMANAASCYAMTPDIRPAELPPCHWPWLDFWKPSPNDRIRELQKAGALIAAEIDRLLSADVEWCIGCNEPFIIQTMHQDDDNNYYCPECWEVLAPVMKAEYDELKAKGEID